MKNNNLWFKSLPLLKRPLSCVGFKGASWSICRLPWPCSINDDMASAEVRAFTLPVRAFLLPVRAFLLPVRAFLLPVLPREAQSCLWRKWVCVYTGPPALTYRKPINIRSPPHCYNIERRIAIQCEAQIVLGVPPQCFRPYYRIWQT
jgi:hypothetical protein